MLHHLQLAPLLACSASYRSSYYGSFPGYTSYSLPVTVPLPHHSVPVSYTHLTLPTILRV